VRLIGYCVEGSLFLVYEHIDNGNLGQYLHGTGIKERKKKKNANIFMQSYNIVKKLLMMVT